MLCYNSSENTYSRLATELSLPMRVTQQDIAKIANVSQATVSRVLAGDQRVEPEIRDRVVAAMQEHNYQPDARARSLRSRRSGLIGLVVKRPHGGLSDDPFFANLVSHIMDFLSGRPYHLCVEMVTDVSSQESVYDEMLRTRRVDGLILVESEARDERIHRLHNEGFPFILIGHPGEQTDFIWSVDNDNQLAGEIATRHLVESGYERIGFLAGPRGVTVSEDRVAGYRAVLSTLQRVSKVWHSEFGFAAARDVALQALGSADRPDAFVVLDDFMAMGVVMAARELGLRIPQDLGIVSFNDSSLCNLLDGGLSSVSLNIPEMVRLATGRLLKIIEDKPIYGERRVIVPCELKVRASSNRGADA